MNLYLWRPKGHGEFSFGVVAESEEEARFLVEQEIARLRSGGMRYETDGWGTDYYVLEVFPPGAVFSHEND